MINIYFRLLDKRILVLMFIALIASPTLCGKETYTVCLIESHYLTMYLNILYLMLVYQQMDRINLLNDSLIIRVGTFRYYLITYVQLLFIGIFYDFIIYISYYFFFGPINKEEITYIIFFIILNSITTAIKNTIIYMQLGKKKRFIYLALPIMINLLFHIAFTQFF